MTAKMAGFVTKLCRLQNHSIMSRVNALLRSSHRSLSSVAGESDGKTTVTIINKDQDLLLINAFSTMGFRLNNNFMAVGPIAIFPKTVLSWNIKTFEDLNENSLSLFYLLEPKIDILVFGTGNKLEKLPDNMRRFLQSKRISFEMLPTEQACATFNFLNSEGRYVAGGLIPPTNLRISEKDLFDSEARRERLFIDEN